MKLQNDIKKELSSLSPLLAEKEKKNPFSVPDNYFNELDHKILFALKNNSVESELEETTQLKSLRSRGNAFDVPYGYFEQLPEKISARIVTEGKTAVIRPLQKYFQHSFRSGKMLAAVSVAAALIVVFLLFKPQPITTTPQNNTITLSSEEVQNYLNANIISIDEQSISGQITTYQSLAGFNNMELDESDLSLIDVSQIDLTTLQNL